MTGFFIQLFMVYDRILYTTVHGYMTVFFILLFMVYDSVLYTTVHGFMTVFFILLFMGLWQCSLNYCS